MDEDFEAVRRDPDPISRGRRATELLAVYQQRSTELARIRRAAIEEARDVLGGSYAEVAKAFGLTKGRITQIRSSAPPAYRAFFGVGPLTVALPGRIILGRQDPVIAGEDDATGTHLIDELGKLVFLTNRFIIDPREEWEPAGDAVVVCGPASAHIGHKLMSQDPLLGMTLGDNVHWYIEDRATGERFLSPMDEREPARADHAYIARHQYGNQVVVHIAGLHALGSVGAAHYLMTSLPDLFANYGDAEFSMAVTTKFDGLTPIETNVLVPPRGWT
ncbi:hypothetical protein [Gandjariella thermophila]|uniref:Sigma-70 family RNA polymerase sigma factor n=1 Tax=Gandjariella thermophila TaxID=1931992 RepID=A0A4D4IWP2_9PSEU|nr:hypothetical protein [Gandjariella thermophila]GDY28765.1 hypothetical protein GTS_03980 [Gandjariella thermophila]